MSVGATALHYAVLEGHLAVAQYLIEHCKAIKNSQTKTQTNLAHAAVKSDQLQMVKYILGKTRMGLHVLSTSDGSTVIHIATGEYAG